jgi:hypothetical protein
MDVVLSRNGECRWRSSSMDVVLSRNGECLWRSSSMDVVLSRNGGCRWRSSSMDVVLSRNDKMVVVYGEYFCCAKHSEKIHVKLRDEVSLREGI